MKICKKCGEPLGPHKLRYCTQCSNILTALSRNKGLCEANRRWTGSRVFHYGYELPFWLVPDDLPREDGSNIVAHEYGKIKDGGKVCHQKSE